MVKLKIEIKATLDSLDAFEPVDGPDTFAPFLKVCCGSCHEVHSNWVSVDPKVSSQGFAMLPLDADYLA